MGFKKLFLVKDLARATGHSTNTVKFYLWHGLLREVARSPYTNFRFFDEGAVARLKKIREMRKKGRSLRDIKESLNDVKAR